MRLLSLGHLSFRMWSKQLGVINHWLRRHKISCDLFFNMNPLCAYFINQSYHPGKQTFLNASFWEKRAAVQATLSFQKHPTALRTILRGDSRVSSLILRAKLWLAKKVHVMEIVSLLGFADAIFRRERSDDRKCVCASQANGCPESLS